MPTLCVITPTISRPTLERSLLSAELGPDDLWIVFGDGPQPEAKKVVHNLWRHRPYLYYLQSEHQTGNSGNRLRDVAMAIADKNYFLFLDDDDVFMPGAIETARSRMNGKPVLFRMKHPTAGIIWKEMSVTPGNVGGSMLMLPNDLSKRAVWDRCAGHGSDVEFVSNTLALWDDYEWAGDVIIEVNPNEL